MKGTVIYYVGVDGVFPSNADAVQAATLLIKKLIQIHAYCSKYAKPVTVMLNGSRVPSYIFTAVRALNLQLLTVVNKDADAKFGEYIQADDPFTFIGKNCDVFLVLKPADSEEEVDLGDVDTPVVNLLFGTREPQVTIETDPNEVVRNFQQPKAKGGDPYAAFYHEPFFQRVPYTYWKDIMDTMPATNTGNGTPNNVW